MPIFIAIISTWEYPYLLGSCVSALYKPHCLAVGPIGHSFILRGSRLSGNESTTLTRLPQGHEWLRKTPHTALYKSSVKRHCSYGAKDKDVMKSRRLHG